MKHFKVMTFLSLLATASSALSYDVVDRFKIIDDKLKTEQMLRPLGHDFFLDVGATLNKNVRDVMDDIEKASNAPANEAVQAAQDALIKYEKTEQTIKINVALGTPLPSFSAWEVKFKPNLRIFLDVGANLGIRSQILTAKDVVNFFPEGIPDDLKALILNLDPGDDVIAECRTQLVGASKIFCDGQPLGKYIMPSITQTVPTLAIFGKGDGKVGFFNDYTYQDHFFGNFNLYGMGRADAFQFVTAEQVAKGQKIEAPDTLNTEITLQSDYRLGYKNANYRVFASVEEMKLATLKDPKAGSKAHVYDYDPLMRVHADALFRYSILSINPFAGLHKRSGYGFGDGVYAGADAGAHVWGDRIGLQLRGMVDKQYLTISPRMKLWLMQLEYSMKSPLKSMDGDVKLTALHSIDFRLFF